MGKLSRLSILFCVLFAVVASTAQVRQSHKFSDWEPIVHLPPPVNSEYDDHAAILSADELTMYFASNRPGSVAGSEDIWVATRKNRNGRWGRVRNLGPLINTPAMERVR